MNAVDLLRSMSFHDSVVNRINFDPTSRELHLAIELGNYNQSTYDATKDPETIPGELVFSGISDFNHEPDSALVPWSAGVDGEIIDLDADPAGEKDFNVKLVVTVTNYESKTNETLVFWLKAADARWQPDPSTLA